MHDQRLTREQILEALTDLIQRLTEKDINARLYIVGGAALTLEYGARDSTRDVDARYYPKDAVTKTAVLVAKKYGLPNDWLNDKAAMFVSPVVDDQNPVLFLSNGTVVVHIASPQVLLAMKIRASRPARDTPDIMFLCKYLDLSSVDQALDIYENYYPEDPLPNRALPILTSILKGGEDPGTQ